MIAKHIIEENKNWEVPRVPTRIKSRHAIMRSGVLAFLRYAFGKMRARAYTRAIGKNISRAAEDYWRQRSCTQNHSAGRRKSSFKAGVNVRHSTVGIALAVVALPDLEWGFDMHIEIGRVGSVGLAAHAHGQHH